MDMLTLQMNVGMYEFMYAKCSETLISKLFPNGIIFIDFKLLITSDVEQKHQAWTQ